MSDNGSSRPGTRDRAPGYVHRPPATAGDDRGEMDHLTDAEIAVLTHHLADGGDDAARAHADACLTCRAILREARRLDAWTGVLLADIDVVMPRITAASTIALAGGRPAPVKSGATRRYAIAASLFVMLTATAALAIPRSPLRRLIEKLANPSRSSAASFPVRSAPPALAPPAGVSIAATTHMSLDFRGPSLPASLTAQSCHTAYASVRVSREKAGTLSPREHFTVSGTTVTVDNVDSTSRLTLVLPRSLSSLRLNYGSWSTDIVAASLFKGSASCGDVVTIPLAPLQLHARNRL